jgi:hypothetical protein
MEKSLIWKKNKVRIMFCVVTDSERICHCSLKTERHVSLRSGSPSKK